MKVPIQKGKIKSDMPTMKTTLRKPMNNEDAKNDRDRREGQILKTHIPKK